MVRIRLKRMGRRHVAFYRINAVEKQCKRDGKVLENLGWYFPAGKEGQQMSLKTERIKHWLTQGAQPSETLMDVFSKEGLVDAEAWKAVRTARVVAKQKNELNKASAATAAAALVEKKKAEKAAGAG